MAGSPAIQIEGLDRLRAELRRVKDAELNAAMKAIHRDIAREISQRADPPYETGRLAASIKAVGTVADAVGRAGSSSVPYAAVIHWGWKARGIPARPFLQNAAAEIEPGVVERYDRAVARMFNRVITP